MTNRLVVLLLAAHALAAIAGIPMVASRPPGLLLEVVTIAVAVAQGCLLGTWVAFGGRPTPWRLAGATVALVLTSVVLNPQPYGRGEPSYAFVVLIQMLGTSVPLLAVRLVGLEVVRPLPNGTNPKVYRFQFSLRGMLEWTTGVAILLAIVPLLSGAFRRMFLPWRWEPVGIFAIDGLVAVAVIWVALGVQRTPVRLGVLAASGVGMAIFLAAMQPPDGALVVVFPLLVAAWLLASLWVFRSLGYRLVWRHSLRL